MQGSKKKSRRRRVFGFSGVVSGLCAWVASLTATLAAAAHRIHYVAPRTPADICLSASAVSA
jgi:hypothetical protein